MGIFVLAFVSSTFVLAGFVKGVIGLGLPTVAMGLLAVVMTPAQAAALLTLPSFLTNVWQAMGPGFLPLAASARSGARERRCPFPTRQMLRRSQRRVKTGGLW